LGNPVCGSPSIEKHQEKKNRKIPRKLYSKKVSLPLLKPLVKHYLNLKRRILEGRNPQKKRVKGLQKEKQLQEHKGKRPPKKRVPQGT